MNYEFIVYPICFYFYMSAKSEESKRIKRERKTIEVMIGLYCRKYHKKHLCDDCRELRQYALARLLNCPFENDKPVCVNCKVHCYKPDMRERIRNVMRFSGPRMLLLHPYLAVMHLFDEKIRKSNIN